MPVSSDNPALPVDCSALGVPLVQFDCAPLREINVGYWSRLLISPTGATGAALTAAEVTTRLALAATAPNDPTAMALLKVTANMPAPAEKTVRYEGADVTLINDFTIDVTVTETNQKNYEFMRLTAKGYGGHFWFVDFLNKYVYGGQLGVAGNLGVMRLHFEGGAGEDDPQLFKGKLTWKGLFAPRRDPSPL